MLINIDSDAIISNFWNHLLHMVNISLGTNLQTRNVTAYYTHDWMNDRQAEIAQKLINAPGFFSELTPYSGSMETIQLLQEAGHEVQIVTAHAWHSVTCVSEKVAWFKHYAPFLHPKNVAIMHHKHLVKCDVAIDDGPKKAVKYREHQPNIKLLSIRWPYHSGIEEQWDFLAESHEDPANAWSELRTELFKIADNHQNTPAFTFSG